eukprot:6494366-Prymnesium_polylepis.1
MAENRLSLGASPLTMSFAMLSICLACCGYFLRMIVAQAHEQAVAAVPVRHQTQPSASNGRWSTKRAGTSFLAC